MPQQRRRRLNGAPVNRRRKPAHRTLRRHRSVLRMGDELIGFKEFVSEGRYNDDGDIHECHDEDHHDGYKAGVEFYMGSGIKEENPHDREKHPECHASWNEGFEQAGDDS